MLLFSSCFLVQHCYKVNESFSRSYCCENPQNNYAEQGHLDSLAFLLARQDNSLQYFPEYFISLLFNDWSYLVPTTPTGRVSYNVLEINFWEFLCLRFTFPSSTSRNLIAHHFIMQKHHHCAAPVLSIYS